MTEDDALELKNEDICKSGAINKKLSYAQEDPFIKSPTMQRIARNSQKLVSAKGRKQPMNSILS